MPVRPVRERIHDFTPVSLDRVQIANRDLEERATQPVVNAGDESLFVLPFLVASNHVGLTGEDRRNQSRNVFRLVLEVCRVENEHLSTRVQVTGAERVSDPASARMSHRLKKRVFRSETLQDAPRIVDGSVVDYDHLIAMGRGSKCDLRLLHEQRKILRFVLGRDENTNIRTTRHRLKRLAALEALRRISLGHGCHTRFRILAERTPSWSRYLATVRRAIWTPLSRRMLTMA